jgi:DNA topoisomerase-3
VAERSRIRQHLRAVKLVVAEKPSVARDLARALGARDKGDGSIRGNGWVVTWCIGHLVELDEPSAYDTKWKRWSFDTLPMIPDAFRLRPAPRTLKQWRVVRDLLRGDFAFVVNACDAGREGELIFRYVYERARSRLPIQRLWISSLTSDAIADGFRRLRPGRDFEALAAAARARSEADWIVGLNATRAMTLTAGRDAGVHSIGRVQTPTLALIVEREQAISRFVPEDFWEVEADVGFVARWTSQSGATRLAKAALADALVARVVGPLTVLRVEERKTQEPAPQLFDLTTLQRTANQRYGFSADRTLRAAQTLYERHKMITYPRTSSRYLGSDQKAGLPGLVATFEGDPAYGTHAKHLARAGLRITRRVVDDAKVSDHHAIVPVSGRKDANKLGADEAKIYDLVVRRFLAALSAAAELKSTYVLLGTGPCDKPKSWSDAILPALPAPPDAFVARGRVVVSPGWHAIEPPKRKDQLLPPVREGDRLDAKLATKQGRTKPPPRHTDATLLAAMETAGKDVEDEALREAMKACGLGTPATRASIIETLLKREYVRRDKKALVPTTKGVALIDGLPNDTLKSAELTGAWEARLSQIAAGREQAARFSQDVETFARRVVGDLAKVEATPTPRRVLGRCPQCSAEVARRGRSFECSACHLSIPGRIAGRELREGEVEQLLRRGRTTKLRGFRSKKKRKFAAILVLRDGEVSFDFGDGAAAAPKARAPERFAYTCPRCQREGIVAGRRAWGCGHWRDGCDFTVPFVFDGKKLTANELKDLLTKGKTRKAAFERGKGRLHLDADRIEWREG